MNVESILEQRAKVEEFQRKQRIGLETLIFTDLIGSTAFRSDWAQLATGTFRFRAPLNKERRFTPRRVDDAATNRLHFRDSVNEKKPLWLQKCFVKHACQLRP
jgi:hypothetical protein